MFSFFFISKCILVGMEVDFCLQLVHKIMTNMDMGYKECATCSFFCRKWFL